MQFKLLWSTSLWVSLIAGSQKIPVDSNGRVSENLLLVRSTAPPAWTRLESVGRRTLLVSDPSLFENEDIIASCIWKGFPANSINQSINTATVKDVQQTFVSKKCEHVEIGFISYFEGESLTITWIDFEGRPSPKHVQYLKAGEKNTEWVHTLPGHVFEVKGKHWNKRYVAETPGAFCDPTCEEELTHSHTGLFTVGSKPDYTALGATISEQNKVSRVRQELARVQQIKRVFTPVGFKKIPVPPKLWAEIQTYWYNNKANRAREEWLHTGFFVNWHEVNQDLLPPPFVLKRRWQDLFQPVLEEWSQTKLEPTDIYGIRTYYDGAWLSNHVDREATHAVSAIINVEQVDLQESWDVHIWDIYGKRHLVSMEPGTALLYESARCMHGRPVPLKGKEYSNIFVHYRPVGNPKWFKDESVGQLGPDVTAIFDPKLASTSDVGWVGEEARLKFHGGAISSEL